MPSQSLLNSLNYQCRVNELILAEPKYAGVAPVLSPDELHAMQGAHKDGMSADAFAALVLQLRALRLAGETPRLALVSTDHVGEGDCDNCGPGHDVVRAHWSRTKYDQLCRQCVITCAEKGCEDCREDLAKWTRDEFARVGG